LYLVTECGGVYREGISAERNEIIGPEIPLKNIEIKNKIVRLLMIMTT